MGAPEMAPADEAAMVDALLQGDERAFEWLVQRYSCNGVGSVCLARSVVLGSRLAGVLSSFYAPRAGLWSGFPEAESGHPTPMQEDPFFS
jgi:hypothetical protein